MEQIDEEAAVLGACLQSSGAWAEVCDYLDGTDFYHEGHRLIWRAMLELHGEGAPISELSVNIKLRDHQKITAAGGAPYLATLADTMPDVEHCLHYAKRVKDNCSDRRLKLLGTNLLKSTAPPDEKIHKAYAELSDIAKKSVTSKVVSIGKSTEVFMANLLDENGVKDAPIDTGFSDLDDILWGIQPSDFFILAARPSIGKTAFSMQVAANIAKKNKRVLFLSLEMNEEQLTRRMLSQESGVSYQRILKSQHLSKDNKAALLEAAARIRTLPLDIDYSSGQQLGSIRNRAHQINSIHTENKIAIIMIDYISLLCTHGENFEELTRISSGLKAMAKDLDIVIWGVSQLSRSGEYRDSRRPQLSDLRMCGEQDADQVLMLWNPNRKKDVVEALLEKHRNGRCGSATFAFDNDTVRFSKGSW